MASQYATKPPSYDSPSAAEDITKILERALDVQKALADARISVQQVDKSIETTFEDDLKAIDDRYYTLFNDSKTAANNLYSAIDQFQSTIVPISQNTSYPVEKRAKSVKTSADKIAAAARANAGPFDEGVAALIRDLTSLYETITETEKRIKKENKAALDKLSEKIDGLAAKIKANGKLFDRLSAGSKKLLTKFKTPKKDDLASNPETPSTEEEPPIPTSDDDKTDSKKDDDEATKTPSTDKYKGLFEGVQMVGSFFEGEATHSTDKKALDAAVGKLSALRDDADMKIYDLKQAGTEIQGLITKFKGLVSKLGNFAVVWKKLANDAALLSEYIATNGLDETTIVERVVAESQVYNKIKHALDEYCLRTG
jgi:hypothetical protein